MTVSPTARPHRREPSSRSRSVLLSPAGTFQSWLHSVFCNRRVATTLRSAAIPIAACTTPTRLGLAGYWNNFFWRDQNGGRASVGKDYFHSVTKRNTILPRASASIPPKTEVWRRCVWRCSPGSIWSSRTCSGSAQRGRSTARCSCASRRWCFMSRRRDSRSTAPRSPFSRGLSC